MIREARLGLALVLLDLIVWIVPAGHPCLPRAKDLAEALSI